MLPLVQGSVLGEVRRGEAEFYMVVFYGGCIRCSDKHLALKKIRNFSVNPSLISNSHLARSPVRAAYLRFVRFLRLCSVLFRTELLKLC